jgi:membrane-associated protease RseP (regulator of RpoE activity)
MTRVFRIIGILACIGGILFVWWLVQQASFNASPQTPLANQPIKSAMRDPVAFAKNHLTGGIGTLLATDPASGCVKIAQVVAGSPAQKAGLQSGDIIIQVNGISTRGRLLAQIVEDIRGLAAGSVTITVQRTGTTNLDITMHRNSWSSLGTPIFGNSPTNPVGPARPVPILTVPSTNQFSK